jgi:hypothetical protein
MDAPSDPLAVFAPLLDALADRFIDRWLAATNSRMVAQTGSPLGPRRHRAAVKRRVANNEGGAAIADRGRRFMLTHEALREELGMKPEPSGSPTPNSDGDGGKGGGKPPLDRVSVFRAELLGKLRGTGGGK